MIPNTKIWLAGAVLLMAPGLNAADYIWTGGGGDGLWSTGANWQDGIAPTGTGHVVHFNSALGEVTSNNQLSSLHNITIGADAGAFTINAPAAFLFAPANSGITSYSSSTQTVNAALNFNAQGSLFDIRRGKLVLNGVLSNPDSHEFFVKEGAGTLEYHGLNTYTGRTYVKHGTLRLNAGSGTLSASDYLSFGDPAVRTANNGRFEIFGGNYTMKHLSTASNGSHVVKSSHALTVEAYSLQGVSTMNFDLSEAGSSLVINGSPTVEGAPTRLERTTVTQGGKTGFALWDSENGNAVTRLQTFVALDSGNPVNANVHASIANSHELPSFDVRANSLTIQGAGTMTGGGLIVKEILMEEGVSGYTLANSVIAPHFRSHKLYIHQYSTAGELTIATRIFGDDGTGDLATTGPGTIRITSTNNVSTGATYIQQGTLILDGALTRTSSVTVYSGATLEGGGRLGETTPGAVTIRSGGRLAGTSSSALEIGGTLFFEKESTLAMSLDGLGSDFISVSGAITLGEGIDLALDLGFAPVGGQSFTVLEGSNITGTFATINGEAFGPDGAFTLNFGGDLFEFQLFSEADQIRVQAIPEPTTFALLGGAAGLGLWLRRRRSKA